MALQDYQNVPTTIDMQQKEMNKSTGIVNAQLPSPIINSPFISCLFENRVSHHISVNSVQEITSKMYHL